MATLLLEPQTEIKPEPSRSQFAVEPPDSGKDRFALERGLALMVIGVAAIYLRARDPLYNTAYMDESIYVVYGRMFLAHHFEAPLGTPLQWTFGWYLWPAMSALADRIGGLLALRELAAALGTITVAATYGFASRVFSKTVGVGAAAVMAVLAPAILVSRIATRDSGSICFFALGLWAFAAAWQDDKTRYWLSAAVTLLGAFLCKYVVAIYLPVLVVLALWKSRKAIVLFVVPLSAACAAYAALYRADLLHLLRYGGSYGSLRGDAFNIYVVARWDLILIAWLAILAFAVGQWRIRAAWMWLGALMAFVFQWQTRADYDFWKHANYALLFLVPAAVAGLLFLVQQLFRGSYLKQMQWGTASVLLLALAVSFLGRVQNFGQFVFWPNVDPVLAFFENRITPQEQILVDDTVFRYYFNPALSQGQIVDPMYFRYRDAGGNNLIGEPAYQAAVRERAFTHVVLDGGMGDEASRLDSAVRPLLGGYHLQMRAVDPVLGHDIEIYSREDALSTQNTGTAAPSIRILSPATGSTASAQHVVARGIVTGAQPGWYVRMEVFTNRWYSQGEAVPITVDGSFSQDINLGGSGRMQCFHLVRARVMDQTGHSRAVALNYGIGRVEAGANCSPTMVLNPATSSGN